MYWCTNCAGTCQIDPYISKVTGSNITAQTSFNRIARSKRMDKLVKMCSSLHLMKKSTLTVSKDRRQVETEANKKQPGQSDRRNPSINPITLKRGRDKKHGSYARYLALKKGNIIRNDTWKYVGDTQIGNKAYTPYSLKNESNAGNSKDCCCYDNCEFPAN
tara:strand:+ start:1040 stop:1522 length:483 start_codon:yes stop_codon:yes gene_type:complete